MLPAFAPQEAHLVNDRSLSVQFRPLDGMLVSLLVRPDGTFIYHHVAARFPDGSWQTISTRA